MKDQRIPPHNLEAEQAILGTVLLKAEAINEVADIIQAGHFYREAHRQIWQAIFELSQAAEPIDLITVSAKLRAAGKLDLIGGPSYLGTLTDLIPFTAHLASYAALVRDYARLRQVIQSAQEIEAGCYEHQAPDIALDVAEAGLLRLLAESSGSTVMPMRELAKKVFGEIEAQANSGSPIAGVCTGFHDLDRMTSGLCPSDLVILAGRPGMGKSALAMNAVRQAAVEDGVPVAVFSLEMSKEQQTQRLFADLGILDTRKLRQGSLQDRDWVKLTHAYGRLAEAKIYIDDTPDLTAMALRTRARRLKAKYNIGLVVVDYLQLMVGSGGSDKREQDISAISRSLKAMAKELGIPVLALSQLNRNLESRPNKRPMLSDLRESGAIEQDADLIVFIYRDEMYNKADDNPHKGIAELIIGKQRHGPTGTVEVAWLEGCSSFRNLVTPT
jgi:replicative DNA helicase